MQLVVEIGVVNVDNYGERGSDHCGVDSDECTIGCFVPVQVFDRDPDRFDRPRRR
ncbi:MAG: hypothetical protein ACLPVY_12020 [Acidimicrobiia bacterium]